MPHRPWIRGPRIVLALAGIWCLGHPPSAAAQQGWLEAVTTVSDPLPDIPGRADVAVNDVGDVVAVWPQAGAFRVARYSGTSGRWFRAVAIGPTSSTLGSPSIALDEAGNALAVWPAAGGVAATRYRAAPDTWGPPVPVASVAAATTVVHPDIAMDAAGNAMAVWSDAGRIKLARYSATAAMWSGAEDIADGDAPRVAMDAAGNAIILCTGAGLNVGAVSAIRYSVATATWGAKIELRAVTQLAAPPQIAFDAAGNAMAMWSGAQATAFAAEAARFVAATSQWGSVATLGVATGPTFGIPSLAVTAAGDAIAAWSTPGGVARASRYSVASGSWSPPADLSAAGVGAEVWDVGVDASGRATVVWTQTGVHAYAARSSGAAWTTPRLLSDTSLRQFFPRVAVQPVGNVTVAWSAGLPACPPGCYGAIQSRRFVITPGAPAITTVTGTPSTLTVGVDPPQTTEPALAPTNYAYSLDGGLTWTNRDPASTASPLAIAGLTDGVPYSLRLRAINSAGEGVPSPRHVATAGSGTNAPTGLVVTDVTGNLVTFAWSPPDVGLVPVEYVLEGGISPGEVLDDAPTGLPVPTFTVSVPAGAYYVRVSGRSGTVRTPESNEIRIFVRVVAPPSAPTNLLGLVNGSNVALSWTNTFGGGAPSSLRLNVTGPIATAVPLPLGDSFTFAGVPPGTYTLSVSAANEAGISPPSNEVTLTFPGGCGGVPGAPLNFQAWRRESTVFMSWSPPASGPAVTSYIVQVTGAFSGSFTTTGRSLSGTARPGIYTLSVAASNTCGTGPPAPPATVVIP